MLFIFYISEVWWKLKSGARLSDKLVGSGIYGERTQEQKAKEVESADHGLDTQEAVLYGDVRDFLASGCQ